jgi:hypothetical protein
VVSRSFEFGTIKSTPSPRRIRVQRAPTSSTRPRSPPNLDQVADANRLLDDEDKSADEVVEEVLRAEAEAEADRKGPPGNGKRGRAEARGDSKSIYVVGRAGFASDRRRILHGSVFHERRPL